MNYQSRLRDFIPGSFIMAAAAFIGLTSCYAEDLDQADLGQSRVALESTQNPQSEASAPVAKKPCPASCATAETTCRASCSTMFAGADNVIRRLNCLSACKASRTICCYLATASTASDGRRCSDGVCSCTGDADCNDMFSSEVCGSIASCDDTNPENPRCSCIETVDASAPGIATSPGPAQRAR